MVTTFLLWSLQSHNSHRYLFKIFQRLKLETATMHFFIRARLLFCPRIQIFWLREMQLA